MLRILLFTIIFIFSSALLTSASSAWVLWGIMKTELQVIGKGKQGVWSYVDAFDEKNQCTSLKESLSKKHTDYRYECIPSEVNPNGIVLY